MLSDTDPNRKILTLEDLKCEIKYDEESDTLWLGNGKPAPGGIDLFPGCIVFFDSDRRTVTGVMQQDARHLLHPYLHDGAGQDCDGA